MRGSTSLAEHVGPAGTHTLMDRFYTEGIEVLMRSGALIERFMGDQIVGTSSRATPASPTPTALDAGLDSCARRATRTVRRRGSRSALACIAAKHFVGAVGRTDGMVDLTALGEDVNVAARLASAAGAGELVVSERTYLDAGSAVDAERRDLTLKSVSRVVAARVLRA